MKLLHLLRHDFRLQFRSGFHGAALLVVTIYIILLMALPEDFVRPTAVFFIVTDTGALGAFFAGASILRERTGGTMKVLWVSPVGRLEVMLSKGINLWGLSVFAGLLLVLVGMGMNGFIPGVGVILTGLFFTLLGMILALDAPGLNVYFFRSILVVVPLFLPLVELIGFMHSNLFLVSPVGATVRLLLSGNDGEILQSILSLSLWSTGAGLILYYKVQHLIPEGGGVTGD